MRENTYTARLGAVEVICDLCGQESKTILLLGINNTLPCVYRQCSECKAEYLTAKEASINKYAKKMEVKDGDVFN